MQIDSRGGKQGTLCDCSKQTGTLFKAVKECVFQHRGQLRESGAEHLENSLKHLHLYYNSIIIKSQGDPPPPGYNVWKSLRKQVVCGKQTRLWVTVSSSHSSTSAFNVSGQTNRKRQVAYLEQSLVEKRIFLRILRIARRVQNPLTCHMRD